MPAWQNYAAHRHPRLPPPLWVLQPSLKAAFRRALNCIHIAANSKLQQTQRKNFTDTTEITTPAACERGSFLQPSGEAVFLQLQKKQDKTYTDQQLENKLQKWNESCWKMTVYTIFSAAAFLVSYQEPWFLSPVRFWDGATAFPLNYYVPFKIVLFYLIELGFYIQAIPFLFFVEVRVCAGHPGCTPWLSGRLTCLHV